MSEAPPPTIDEKAKPFCIWLSECDQINQDFFYELPNFIFTIAFTIYFCLEKSNSNLWKFRTETFSYGSFIYMLKVLLLLFKSKIDTFLILMVPALTSFWVSGIIACGLILLLLIGLIFIHHTRKPVISVEHHFEIIIFAALSCVGFISLVLSNICLDYCYKTSKAEGLYRGHFNVLTAIVAYIITVLYCLIYSFYMKTPATQQNLIAVVQYDPIEIKINEEAEHLIERKQRQPATVSSITDKNDEILLSLLSNMEGGIDDLFDLIFNFLNRKYDYFTGMDIAVSRKRLLEVYDKYANGVEKLKAEKQRQKDEQNRKLAEARAAQKAKEEAQFKAAAPEPKIKEITDEEAEELQKKLASREQQQSELTPSASSSSSSQSHATTAEDKQKNEEDKKKLKPNKRIIDETLETMKKTDEQHKSVGSLPTKSLLTEQKEVEEQISTNNELTKAEQEMLESQIQQQSVFQSSSSTDPCVSSPLTKEKAQEAENSNNEHISLSFSNELNKRWDTVEDGRRIATKILDTSNIDTLDLSGNTLGIDASGPIAEALKKHPELKIAQWKDLFTTRLNTEIPFVLKSLTDAMRFAQTRLTTLDLSDNAIGPQAIHGLQDFLSSEACFGLKNLCLKNCGMGSAGTIIARCLIECHQKAIRAGKFFELEVFVAGRNRLENSGAEALAEAFSTFKSLVEVKMDQNGIEDAGIKELAKAFAQNPKLKIIDLNDNTFNEPAATVMSKVLGKLKNLVCVDFTDCLCRAAGCENILQELVDAESQVQELLLGGNEIGPKAMQKIAQLSLQLPSIKKLVLSSNNLGSKFNTVKQQLENEIIDLGAESDDQGTVTESEEEDDDL